MALRIHESIVRGEIDNTEHGVVVGRIWLLGRDNPILLKLAGNCWRDLAGRRCSFTNPAPKHPPMADLAETQTGEVGDITASRKVRVLELPLNECYERRRQGLDVPEHMSNSLYLEWYSDSNGRVVIESADYRLDVSLPEWEMSCEEERQQREQNTETMRRFLDRLEATLRPDNAINLPEDREMNEFEWECFLRQSDARTERLGELVDKFGDHPDCDRLIAQHMGWDGLLEAMDAVEKEKDTTIWEDLEDIDGWEEPDPDPETEGTDWVWNDHGGISHPIQLRCQDLGVRMHRKADAMGVRFSEDGEVIDSDIDDMVFNVQRTSAKLAGALSTVVHGIRPMPGFVVATLKRALSYLHEGLAAIDRVKASGKMDGVIDGYRSEAFEIRSAIIDLMQRYRRQ